MYDQFLELAGVDITKEPMQVGPTCHYFMGGIKVDADTGATARPRAVRDRRSERRHERRQPARRQLARRPAGLWPTRRDSAPPRSPGSAPRCRCRPTRSRLRRVRSTTTSTALATENPFQMHKELQTIMGDGVGIFRDKEGLTEAIDKLESLEGRVGNLKSPSNRLDYNPGWQLCREIKNMLTVSLMIARGALMREESRGGHSRLDSRDYSDYWSENNIVVHSEGDKDMVLTPTPGRQARRTDRAGRGT